MTTDEARQGDGFDEQGCLVVAALADGELVDPDALRAALEDPAARDYLVDLIALRTAVATLNQTSDVRWRRHESLRSRLRWFGAAAAVIVSLVAGYAVGQRTVQAPPAPAVETVVHLENTTGVPKPTRVISLRPGINWTEKAGER